VSPVGVKIPKNWEKGKKTVKGPWDFGDRKKLNVVPGFSGVVDQKKKQGKQRGRSRGEGHPQGGEFKKSKETQRRVKKKRKRS